MEPLLSPGAIRFSVIIPAFNEARVIRHCLDALSRSDLLKNAFEVFVMDNGSSDGTVDIAKSYGGIFNLEVITVAGVRISALRNRGAREARGKFLAFLDADCIAPPNWLVNAASIFARDSSGIIGAHYEIPRDATWVGRLWCQDRLSERVGDVSYVPGGDLLITKDCFLEVGGFDESIQTNEDLELCQRVIEKGWPVRAYPELRVTHLGTPRTLIGFYRKQQWHGTHVFTVFLRDPQKRKNVKPVMLAVYTLACFAGSILGAVWGALQPEWWAVCIFPAALILPLVGIAGFRSVARKRWADILPLTALYLTFGIARASSLLRYKTWKSA